MIRDKFVLCFFLILLRVDLQYGAKEEEIVEQWANKLGEELWELGLSVTKAPEIKTTYKKLNARVLPTDGEGILNTIVSNVNRLLKMKMDSVMCIIDTAEELGEEFTSIAETKYSYYSAKYSLEPGGEPSESEEELGIDRQMYKEIQLTPDQAFYGIPVNTTHSAVHVPTDVDDQSESVQLALQWSEGLDAVFIQNYMSDPTMSWQYFGSSTGFLRHFPGIHWNYETDHFDCRTRFWYIEAATCSKDIVILIDNSGSMTGMRNTIARLAVNTILETFSNNDFINIFSFNKTTKALVPCFPRDLLVQATRENIERFKESVNLLKPEDKADFPKAFRAAFSLLEKHRENKTCPEGMCNQAIMLLTDNVPDNLTQVFEKYNWFENRTRIPVRIFTYLIGIEVTNAREMQQMACQNRGYYVHIKSLEEVRSQVLKYISVIARPLVLQATEHPLTWTHTFVDITGNTEAQASRHKFRMMTSISGPAFDRKINKNNETRMAELLGVAGTDVLITDIQKLTLPYKIGANGYSFILTNNGYLLFHPDLRPESNGILKENYNSIDLTEVELLDDDNTDPRDPSPEIFQLRELMVSHEEGSMRDLKMKFHYDNMRRVGAETRHYYYAPLNNTPFTLGLVLPHSYGNYWIKAGDEIRKSIQMGINITSYFKGNWRIHPEWVYCDYHRHKGSHFKTPEDKIMHFLTKMSSPGWQWKEQFSPEEELYQSEYNRTFNCNRRVIEEDEYYCDKELMQLLVFDAKSTEGSYKSAKWAAKNRREDELVKLYGATLRFVATQSGLTRWQDIPGSVEGIAPFGDTNCFALDEVWYKSAVLHHHIDPDAFVFSVPFDSGSIENIAVTASHAIFPRDGGLEAPGSVVGFHMRHSALYDRFIDITSRTNCRECAESCATDKLDCYVIDGNGYIVISESRNDTGRFFGDIEGAIMEAMVSKNIFRQVPMFDYQALCFTEILIGSGVDMLWTPFKKLTSIFIWLLGKLALILIESSFPFYATADVQDYFDGNIISDNKEPVKPIFGFKRPTEKYEIRAEACDQVGNLYLLQHLSKEGYHSAIPVNCSRPFYVKRVPYTNLLLIVVNALHQSCYRKVSTHMEKIEYNESYISHPSCQKLNINSLPRRRLSGCFNTHPLEEEINMCGKSNTLDANKVILLTGLLSICSFVIDLF